MVIGSKLPHSGRHALVFDLDGTLIESMPWHARAWAALFEENGIAIEPDEFVRATAGKMNSEILRERFGHALTSEEQARLSARKEHLYRSLYEPHVRAIAGAGALLETARRLGLRMAMASAAPMENIVFVLERTRLGPYFDTIVCADDGLPGKPAPDMFQLAARRLSTEPRNAVVFEDALAGLTAARNAGMRAVAVTTTLSPDELAGRPEIIAMVPHFADFDLEALLFENSAQAPASAGK